MSGLRVVLVTAADCHLCEHAHAVVGALESEFALEVAELDWESAEGQALVGAGAAAFPPALFVDGQLAAYGRLSPGRLRNLFASGVRR